MKKLIAIVVFLVNAVGLSAQTYCDFMGIPLGIHKDAFDKQMKEKGFEPLDFIYDMGDNYNYSGMYCDQKVYVRVDFNYIEGFVYSVYVTFYNENESSRSALFNRLVRKLKQEHQGWKVEIKDEGSYWFSYWTDKKFPMAVITLEKATSDESEPGEYPVELYIVDFIRNSLNKKMMGD